MHVEGDKRVTRAHMNGECNLFFAHIIQCMGTNTGSHDQANVMQCQIAEALMTGRGIDFAGLIFEDLKKRVTAKKRDPNVPYPRFLSLIFKRIVGPDYGLDNLGEAFGSLASLPVAKLGSTVFTHKPAFR